MAKRHHWIIRLSLPTLLSLLPSLLLGRSILFCEERSPAAAKLIGWLGLDVRSFCYSMSVEDPTGRNVRARAEELKAVLRHRLLQDGRDFSWLPEEERRFGAEWQRLLSGHCFETCQEPGSTLAFVENCYCLGEVGAETPTEVVVHLGAHPLAKDLGRLNIPMRLPFVFRLKARRSNLLARYLLQQAWRLSYYLRRQLRPRPPEVHIPAPDQGIILVQYESGLIERLPVGATIDWLEYSDIDPRRVVFYFNRQDSPLTDDVRQILSRHGFGWADFNQLDNYLDQPLRFGLRSLLASLRLLPGVRSHYDFWRWQIVSADLQRIAAHRQFFRKYKTLSVHQHFEFMSYTLMQVLACRHEDVLFVWNFWSSVVFKASWYDQAVADILMTWGDFDRSYCDNHDFDYRYSVHTGALGFDGAEPGDDAKAVEIRGKLWANPRFVLSLFDSSHAKKSMHHSTERCALFYRLTLELVRDNPDWGCIIKSKNQDLREFDENPELQDLYEALLAQGRAVILPRTVKPSLAARASDAALCFAVNSAGFLISIMTDRPVLHFDPNHLMIHPLYQDEAEGKIFFRDPESFIAAVHSLAQGERRFGDLGPWKADYDAFLDGVGRQRSGRIISDYVAGRDHGLPLDAALRQAVQAHADRYGDDFVITRGERRESRFQKLWALTERVHYPDWPPSPPFTQAALSTQPIRRQGTDPS